MRDFHAIQPQQRPVWAGDAYETFYVGAPKSALAAMFYVILSVATDVPREDRRPAGDAHHAGSTTRCSEIATESA